MSNPNKKARALLRWTHLLVGFLIGVLVYTPARDSEAFVLLMQAIIVPVVTQTGLWMWQQGRIRRLYRRLSGRVNPRGGTPGSRPPEHTSGDADVLRRLLNLVSKRFVRRGRQEGVSR
ncbi:hypothetical protein GBA65_01745 [Rubrobacter marinus]|uniref:Transmembrane protein n=1 Tax=Rubrobacter marinus TaxID=2653852 RepID=A0A6G8PSI0_9ACTN|nr:hypothetical protein [Rubrobacter marinus]QIN77439.1 hypothetical protein GBA65_01745 [Rubrobacter marinus]